MSMPARPNPDAQQDALKVRLKKEIMRELVLELNLDKPTPAQRVRRFLTEEKRKWRRHPFSTLARLLCRLAMLITMFCLLYLVGDVLVKGVPNLKPSLFAWKYTTDNVSMLPALINTVIIALTSLVVAIPLGMGGAIYLAEYARRDSRLVKIIRLTAETLQGIPSIVYGLFGMVFFTTLHCNYTLLAGALTLSLMVLPLILRTTEEALLSIPEAGRQPVLHGLARAALEHFSRRAPGVPSLHLLVFDFDGTFLFKESLRRAPGTVAIPLPSPDDGTTDSPEDTSSDGQAPDIGLSYFIDRP